MGYRTIVIKNKSKLELQLNYLVCRGEQDIKVNIDEISMVIVQNIACSLTAALLSKLVEKKIAVIFCDEKNNPQFELTPYHSSFNSYAKIKKQISWEDEHKEKIWKIIVKEKILNQAKVLSKKKLQKEYDLLLSYVEDVTDGDTTNREGHAAKVYFNALFGMNFSRKDNSIPNTFLNYGYSIILSSINREITAFGYLTQLGIHHIGETNPFNLACDLMEPLRPFVDNFILSNDINEENFKKIIPTLLNQKVTFEEKECFLDNAIHLYIQNVLTNLNNKTCNIKFIIYEP